MKTDLEQRITFNPRQCGGQPCIRGLRRPSDRMAGSVGADSCGGGFLADRVEPRAIKRPSPMMIDIVLEPIATDWAWLDALAGPLDADFQLAVAEQPVAQERSELDSLLD